ncbi:MAG TPA: DUF1707 domain-containing protein [Streptosporangiaceae bacterium]|nr:DUF1707 domain-containing protein [Streptosporangiaceae bacterium]
MAAGYNQFGPGGNMRVGDAEREAVASQLREHYATGRLTLDELNERLDQAFAAKTRFDLAAVTRDLPQAGQPAAGTPGPGGAPGPPGWPGQGTGVGGPGWLRSGILAVVPVLLAIWGFLVLGSALAFGFGGGRPLGIILLIAALALLRRMFGWRRRYARGCGRLGRRW